MSSSKTRNRQPQMIPTTITHGALSIDMDSTGTVRLSRRDVGQAIELSMSEWNYVQLVAQLHGYPIVSNEQIREIVARYTEEKTDDEEA